MLRYSDVASHNFLDPSWFKKFRENGISMDDASWWIIEDPETHEKFVIDEEEKSWLTPESLITPTYTLPDLIYKLHEWIHIQDKFRGPLGFIKDAPFYVWTYYNSMKESDFTFSDGKRWIECMGEKPIEAAAEMLLRLAKEGLGCVENIKGKYDSRDSKSNI